MKAIQIAGRNVLRLDSVNGKRQKEQVNHHGKAGHMNKANILHIFTDMQRADTIGATGNHVIKTPHLDRLCKEGVAFTNAFSPSPVCISARCSMIHGQYPHDTGCYENTPMPTDGRDTFMTALTRAGYRTHGIGKCHFSSDSYALRGFESRERQEEGGASIADLDRNPYLKYLRDNGYDHICEAYGVRGEMYYIPQPSQLPAEHHPTQWVGNRSIAFIKNRSADRQPWYLFSSFIHPHPPFCPPNPWHKLYRPTMMPLPVMPDDHRSLHTFINRLQNRFKYRDQGRDLNLIRAIKAYYYACISFIDYQIGRILKTLESTGQLDNTLILFTADHGEYLGDYSCWGKRSMHDAAARVPMIVRMPGRFDSGAVCETPVSLVDVAPTFLSITETEMQSHKPSGVDLLDIISGNSDRKYVYSQLSTGSRMAAILGVGSPAMYDSAREEVAAASMYMCVSREWKYFYSAPDDREFFFDRLGDPQEKRNKAGVKFCQEEKNAHKDALITFLREGGETAGLDGDTWRKYPTLDISDDPDSGLLIQDAYTPWADMELPAEYGKGS